MCTQPLLNEDIMYQEDEQPINIQEYYVDSTSAVNGIKSLSTVEKEKPPLSSLVKSNLSNVASVDKVCILHYLKSYQLTRINKMPLHNNYQYSNVFKHLKFFCCNTLSWFVVDRFEQNNYKRRHDKIIAHDQSSIVLR